VVLKIHLELNKVMHLGDALLSRVTDRLINQKHIHSVPLLVECLKQLTEDMHHHNYAIINENEMNPRLYEYVPSASSKI
jgi:hypothetical protein